jgi:PAS domain S-box-containing protein
LPSRGPTAATCSSTGVRPGSSGWTTRRTRFGRRRADFLIPETAERFAAQDRAVVERGEPILDELLVERRPDGSLRYYRHNRLALRDATGAVVAVVSASSDITALKEAEHALARERDLLQSILDALPANVYLKDAAGRYLRINRAAAHYLGLDDPAVAIGQTAEDLWPPDWAAEFRREDEAVLTGAPFTRQVEGVHADGVVRDYLYSRVPVHDGLGNVAGTVTVSTDVTVMKEAERRLAEALAKEQATTAELENLSRAKSGFLSMLTHEFRTPLTAIQGYADLIHDREFDLSPEEIREYAGEIAASAQRLTRMTSDLLELDRVRAKRVVLGLAPTDLGAVAREVVNLLRSSTGGHDFLLDLDGAVPPILADGDRLTQVVINLVGNAIKYSPDGGTVMVRTRRDGDDVLLSVGDRGIGIPEELLEHIFEPYVRISNAGGRGIVGTGLGLPIARELVTLHGGRIWAESRAGEGTTFTVRLPIAGPDAGAVGWE